MPNSWLSYLILTKVDLDILSYGIKSWYYKIWISKAIAIDVIVLEYFFNV